MSVVYGMEPMLPADPGLRDLAAELVDAAGALGRALHPNTAEAVAGLLKTVNCYYSNLIEGHDTHPSAIESAMREEYAAGSAERQLQIEALAHIEVQRLIDTRLAESPDTDVVSPEYVRWIHEEFYRGLPDGLRWVTNPETGESREVIPGKLRDYDVMVGRHVPPGPCDIGPALERFGEVYRPANFHGADALVALAAAHHRLLWIHPFGDGNGRVARLVTDSYLRCVGARGHGLWMAARGLARRRTEYQAALAEADRPRHDDYDGRGALSLKGLVNFCRFFLDTCRDQIAYMHKLLEVDRLAERVESYGKARELGVLPNKDGLTGKPHRFRGESTRLVRDLIYRGSIPRGEVPEMLGLERRTARRVVERLEEDGFINSDSSRAPLRLRIPAHAAPYWFPGLYAPHS